MLLSKTQKFLIEKMQNELTKDQETATAAEDEGNAVAQRLDSGNGSRAKT